MMIGFDRSGANLTPFGALERLRVLQRQHARPCVCESAFCGRLFTLASQAGGTARYRSTAVSVTAGAPAAAAMHRQRSICAVVVSQGFG